MTRNLTGTRTLAGTLVIASALCLATPATSQSMPDRRGAFSAAAHAFSLSGGGPNVLFGKRTGDQPPNPVAIQPNGPGPDYRLSSMFPDHHHLMEVDAISSGNDVIPISTGVNAGQFAVPTEGWATLIVSVSQTAKGQPNTWLSQRSTFGTGTGYSSGPGLGADLIGYYPLGTANTMGDLAGTAQLEQPAAAIGLDPAEELDGLDLQMSLLSMNEGQGEPPLFGVTGRVYLSVSNASAQAIEAHDTAPGYQGTQFFETGTASGATIVVVYWNGSSWSEPANFKTPSDLGLLVFEDVDAIGVNGINESLIFSTDGAVFPRDQLLFIGGSMTAPVPLVDGTSGTIQNEIGVLPEDDIDAICGLDPEISAGFSRWLGMPTSSSLLNEMSLSVCTYKEYKSSPYITTQVTAWPDLTETIQFEISTNNGPFVPFASFGFVQEDAGVLEANFDLPSGLPTDVVVRARAMNSIGKAIATSWTSTIEI